MVEGNRMAEEQYVNRDQHRADMAQLRGELKEEIAGLRHDMVGMRGELKEEIAGVRQDVAVLAKTVEHLGHTMTSGFADMRQAMMDMRQAIGDLGTRLDQTRNELGTRLDQTRNELGTHLDRQEVTLRQEIREVRTTNQRQLWVLIGVVIVTMVGGMIKVVFFP
jgi:chromosome segregation ATPase